MSVARLLACALLVAPAVAHAGASFATSCHLVDAKVACDITNLDDEPRGACVRAVVTLLPLHERIRHATRKAKGCTADIPPGGVAHLETRFHDSDGDVARCARGGIPCTWTREVTEHTGLHVTLGRAFHRYGGWWSTAGVLSLLGFGVWRVVRRRA